MWDFKGKAVAVTGASRGIGHEIARRFSLAGAQVAICSPEEREIVCAARAIGEDVLPFQADVRDLAQNESFLRAAIERFGKLDVLVCNAGIEIRKPCLEITPQEWDDMFNINVRPFFFGAVYVARDMMRRNAPGTIIGISSVNSVSVNPGLSVYAATKCSMSHLAESFTCEWGKRGVRVNCVAPGSIPTAINQKIYSNPANVRTMCEKVPLGRQGTCGDVAEAVLFLASDSAAYIAGQTLFVDGGVTVVRG